MVSLNSVRIKNYILTAVCHLDFQQSKALFIVRTIGQAFEVCHRLQQDTSEDGKEDESAKKGKILRS